MESGIENPDSDVDSAQVESESELTQLSCIQLDLVTIVSFLFFLCLLLWREGGIFLSNCDCPESIFSLIKYKFGCQSKRGKVIGIFVSTVNCSVLI